MTKVKTKRQKEELRLIREFAEIPLLFRILHTVRCRRCKEILTSPRSVRLGIGQRCKWEEDEELGRRVHRGPHMKEEVDFVGGRGEKVTSGVKVLYVQSTLGDF